ncbi:MAG TPA: PilZ domain-containing protein [Anaeromyxobacteraceae bacterium]|nr:PilZ domain-containing protein [Anaeromyxobacteraceae bacterium]
MSLRDWIAAFRAQHEQARTGTLSKEGWEAYRAGRDELARALLGAQRASLRPGETPRQALRVARALQADLDWTTDKVRAVTLDVSTGGFAVLLAKAPPKGEEVKVQLRIPGGDALSGEARVAGIQVQPKAVRVAFAFTRLAEADRDRVEFLVFDTVLGQLSI